MGSARRKQCVQNKGVKQDKLINISYTRMNPDLFISLTTTLTAPQLVAALATTASHAARVVSIGLIPFATRRKEGFNFNLSPLSRIVSRSTTAI
jgi:hypothetical protein